MTTLTRDQILEASDLATEEVSVPEWGGTVRVRSMTGADRDAFEAGLIKADADGKRTTDMSNLKVKLVALTAVDDAGNRIFSQDDVARLGAKSAAAIERVFEVAQRLNGMGAKAEDAAVKNS